MKCIKSTHCKDEMSGNKNVEMSATHYTNDFYSGQYELPLSLVSVIAVSYRSASTLIETLNSIREQTYPRIELIICDDCSDDDTAEICLNWLEKNKKRFERTAFISQSNNSGIVQNYKAGLDNSRGCWIKPIACDDILKNDAIEILVNSAVKHRTDWVFCQCTKFSNAKPTLPYLTEISNDVIPPIRFNKNYLLSKMIRSNILSAPCCFFSRYLLDEVGGLDIRFRHLDDWPLWIKAIMSGFMPVIIHESLVLYRVNSSSISNVDAGFATKPLLHDDLGLFYRIYQRKHISMFERFDILLTRFRQTVALKYCSNKRWAMMVLLPIHAISPFFWRRILNERLLCVLRNRTRVTSMNANSLK